MAKFQHINLLLPNPSFDSPLTDLIVELEHLRRKKIEGNTHPFIFFQLKEIFHMLESIGSARIEGNNTTIAQFVESRLEERPYINEDIQEIRNIEKAMAFIDGHINEHPINRSIVSELHKIIVSELNPPPHGEGDHYPGQYRKHQVEIKGARHLPPPPYLIDQLMDELLEFINKDIPQKYDLLRTAIAHHRFMWIHPFGNGNGRTGRLFTYAMLVKLGFNVNVGKILNPTAVFCIDRNAYTEYLSLADEGKKENFEKWCIYVLDGLKKEIDKIDKIADYDYLLKQVLLPALQYSLKMKYIDEEDHQILKKAAEQQTIQAGDLKPIFKNVHATTISRKIKGLREKKMLVPEQAGSNKYHLNFSTNFLIRGIIKMLEKEDFIPLKGES